MSSRAREKFYDLYAVLQGEEVPNRELVIEGKKKKKIKKKLSEEVVEEVPEALEKVMKEFYHGSPQKKAPKHIGKDVLELKHERDLAVLNSQVKKKKQKKKSKLQFEQLSKEFTSMTGEKVEGMRITPMKPHKKSTFTETELPSKRNVEFNLKMNTTQLFDKKNIISTLPLPKSPAPAKGILKEKYLKKKQNLKKRQKTS